MSSLLSWFTTALSDIGWSGLEGVHEYLEQLSDEGVRSHLLDLLGNKDESKKLIEGYISRRNVGRNCAGPSSKTEGTHAQSRRRDRDTQSRSKKAGKTKHERTPRSSRSGTAATQSSVEEIRQKVREYYQKKTPINCTNCGNIDLVIAQNGACSFCGKPMFSMLTRDPQEELFHMEKLSINEQKKNGKQENVALPPSSRTMVDLSGTPIKVSQARRDAAHVYPERPLKNSTLPGGGPKFHSQSTEELVNVFQAWTHKVQYDPCIVQFEN